MKSIPIWVWLAAAAAGLYLVTRPSAVTAGTQAYLPANTPLYTDAALTQSAGSSSIATVAPVALVQGNSSQINLGGTPYWVNSSTLQAATTAQIAANTAGTLS